MTTDLKTLKKIPEIISRIDETFGNVYIGDTCHKSDLRAEAIKYLEIEKSEDVKQWIRKFFNI